MCEMHFVDDVNECWSCCMKWVPLFSHNVQDCVRRSSQHLRAKTACESSLHRMSRQHVARNRQAHF
jgi:hypothetical protein